MLGSAAKVDVLQGVVAGQAEDESLEACWRRKLEAAGNLLCRLGADEVSRVSVVIPLSGLPGEVDRLDSLGGRLAAERELDYRTKVGARTITITYSNRV